MNPEEYPQIAIRRTNPLSSKVNVVPVIREFVGAGDANAAILLSALFGHFQKTTEFRLASETSYADLSDSPTVLIGAFSNPWTIAMTAATPFGFVEKAYVRSIEERIGKKRLWTSPNLRFDGKTDVDFAIVSRVLNAQTGHFFISAAGITGNGSRAAGYFLTRPDLLAKGLQGAPADWESKNIQFVLRTRIVDGTPSVPEVIAREVW
jgi:ABC-type nitrate/sulfonate/bicarbonate transport system substrate-binding protein